MGLHHRTADRQPHPHTAALGGVERPEHLLPLLGRNPRPVVVHANLHRIPDDRRSNPQHPVTAIPRQRLQPVVDQVVHQLLQLHRVGHHTHPCLQPCLHLHRALGGIGRGQAHDLADKLVQLHGLELHRRLFGQRTQCAHDVGCTLAVVADVFQAGNRLFQVGLGAVEPAQAGGGVGGNPQQRLADLVGDGRRQLVHHLQVRTAGQLCTRAAQLGLHLRAALVVFGQARIELGGLQRHRRLRGEDLQHGQALAAEQVGHQAVFQVHQADQHALDHQRQAQHRTGIARLQLMAKGFGTVALGIVEHQWLAGAHGGVDDRQWCLGHELLAVVHAHVQPGIVDVGEGSHLEFGATDDQQGAVVGTGMLGQMAHQGFDQPFEQHFFRQRARRFYAGLQVQLGLVVGVAGFLDRLGAQEGVQRLQLMHLAGRPPDMETVAGNAQVQVGTGNQAAGDTHLGQLFMGQGLFVDEAGSGGGDLRLVEAADGAQAVAFELGDHAFDQQQLVAEGGRVETGPAAEALAQGLQLAQLVGNAASGLGAAQGQAAEQVKVGQVDVRRYCPRVVCGQCQVAHGLRDIAQVEVAHAGEQVLEEPRRGRFRGCGRGWAGRAAQTGDERLLG